jgi:uncharacterized membrane protein HdeD (DUF308 family)
LPATIAAESLFALMTSESHAGPSGETRWRAEPPPGAARPPAAPDEAPPRRGRLVAAGLLGLVLALVAFAVPALASVGTAIFAGWVLVFASAIMGVEAFSRQGPRRILTRLLLAAITLAAGLYLLTSPLEGTFTLTVMLVIWFVAAGIARIVAGLAELGTSGAGLTISSGAVSLGLGVLVGVELPSSADWAIGLLVGLDLFLFSLIALWLAWKQPA